MIKPLAIFWQFLCLGCISFGGPAAHLVAFKRHFVDKKQWLDNASYERLFALSHLLPGPSSSQVGFGIGLKRAGLPGGLCAFLGFTMPSFLLLFSLALLNLHVETIREHAAFIIFKSSIKLLIIVVVAEALVIMGKKFCNTPKTATLALTILIVSFSSSLWLNFLYSQMILLLCVAVSAGVFSYFKEKGKKRNTDTVFNHFQAISSQFAPPRNRTIEKGCAKKNWALYLFIFLLILSTTIALTPPSINSPTSPFMNNTLMLSAQFYQAGSLVFGGGHVVLPLLEPLTAETLTKDEFLLGYGAAQIIPGPVFSVSAYLGAILSSEQLLLGAVIACISLFLPGFLLIIACLHYWEHWSQSIVVNNTMIAINASVVGLLAAAFIQPIVIHGIDTMGNFFITSAAFYGLYVLRLPVLWLLPLIILASTMQLFLFN